MIMNDIGLKYLERKRRGKSPGMLEVPQYESASVRNTISKLLSAARSGCARPFPPEAHMALPRVHKHDGAQVAGIADRVNAFDILDNNGCTGPRGGRVDRRKATCLKEKVLISLKCFTWKAMRIRPEKLNVP